MARRRTFGRPSTKHFVAGDLSWCCSFLFALAGRASALTTLLDTSLGVVAQMMVQALVVLDFVPLDVRIFSVCSAA